MGETQPSNSRAYIIKHWHVVIMLIVQFAGILFAAAVWKGGQDKTNEEVQRRLNQVENGRFVSKDEFDTWRQDVRDTLDRIEAEILARNRIEGR